MRLKEINIVFWLAYLSLLEAMQITAVLAWILHAVPISATLTKSVLPEWQYLLRPEWEVFIFRFFILAAPAILSIYLLYWRNKGIEVLHQAGAKAFIITESLITFLLISALFKMTVYNHHPQLAQDALVIMIGISILHKSAWPWIHAKIKEAGAFIAVPENRGFLNKMLMLLMPAVICLIIYTPNVNAVMARFFLGEQFHHNDSFVFGPSFAFVSGCRPDIDIISQYGVGVGVIFGSISQWLGGFSYETVYMIMIVGIIMYYILLFVFLKKWLSSTILAAAGIFFILKIQMFNAGVFPFSLTYGSATVLRFWFDIIVFLCFLFHLKRPLCRYLLIAALACGAQLFYIPTDGVYLMGAYVLYVLLQVLRQQWKVGLVLMAAPAIVLLVLWHLFIGDAIYTVTFKHHLTEFVQYFLSGFGVTPIYSSLLDRQFLSSAMGFVMPTVYVLTVLVVSTLLFLKKIDQRHVLVLVICFYGLAQYHYYVARSAETSYYVVAIPYGMICCFWAKALSDQLSDAKARMMRVGLLSLCVWALVTNHQFLAYPNILNFSHNPITDPLVAQPLKDGQPYFNHLFRNYEPSLKVPVNSLGKQDEQLVKETDFTSDDELVSFYKKESDFSQDAALIDAYTHPGQPVPLISSFEVKMLMQAQRRPYFYYFPLVISHPLTSRNLVRISLYTTDQLTDVLNRLKEDQPEYIFMEKLFLTRPLPKYFYYYYSSMLVLTDYVLEQYTPVAAGKFLVAMKRNAPKEIIKNDDRKTQ